MPAFDNLEAWVQDLRERYVADILISHRHAHLPFLVISPPSLEGVPLEGLDDRIIKHCCKEVEEMSEDRSAKIKIERFSFRAPKNGMDMPYSVLLARATGIAIRTLQDVVSYSARSDQSCTRDIESVSRFALFDRHTVMDDDRANELYLGLTDEKGEIQSRAAGWIFGAPRSFGCIIGTRLPEGMYEVPKGVILRSELWALPLSMQSSIPLWKNPGPCFVLSFTDYYARVVVARYQSARVAGQRDYLEVQVVLNERLILDKNGSYDTKVYRKILGWGFFRSMKKVKGRTSSGWQSQHYDSCGWVSDNEDTEAW